LKQISKLKSWFNPDPSRFMEVQDSGRDLVVESANFAFHSLDLVEEPKTFAEAYIKIKWRDVISKEFDDMNAKGVWKKFRSRTCPAVEIALKVNGYSKLSATEFIARGWWCVGTVRYPESIFTRVLHP
jgi:hypothetical protein